MEQRNVAGFSFIRRQSETSLHRLNQDYNANVKKSAATYGTAASLYRSSTFHARDLHAGGRDVTGGGGGGHHAMEVKVTLPDRFKSRLRRSNSASSAGSTSSGKCLRDIDEDIVVTGASAGSPAGAVVEPVPVEWSERKSDMQRAIAWVKQQLVSD